MKCPHCTVAFHDVWTRVQMTYHGQIVGWIYETAKCPDCENWVIRIVPPAGEAFLVHPRGANRGPVPPEVPANIADDYIEACDVLPISAKASAALARRCLQNVLRAHGYKARDLANEIDLLLNESDMRKAIPSTLRMTVDAIRNFGNFSAHPITDVTSLQIIDVEPGEAEWSLEVLEALFDHFYVGPSIAAKKKAALDAKLAAAGKPPSKA